MFQMLLEFHSPYLPRAEDGRTPLDLATTYEYEDCVKELGNFITHVLFINEKLRNTNIDSVTLHAG